MSFLRKLEKRFGRLDILIDNAATNPYFVDMLGVDESVWDKTNDVNLKGLFFNYTCDTSHYRVWRRGSR